MFEMAAIIIGKVVIVISVLLTCCAYSTYMERKVLARLQQRVGPLYTGPYGLLQPIADAVKLIFKEDLMPEAAEKVIFTLAPIISFVPALLIFAVVPFSDSFSVFGIETPGVISDLNIGILYVFAVTSLAVYGIILAGWASGSKYSLMGGLRSSAQMISYEISYGLSIIGVVIIAQSLSLNTIVAAQGSESIWFFENWFVFKQPLGFLLFAICGIAETNRTPFDLAEAESELVGGYNTEYSSLKFSLFFIGEYAAMIGVASVAATLFFGGWQGPFLPAPVWLLLKIFCIMFAYIWLRGTMPRFRYDQLMSFGWKVLFPLAILNTLLTGFWRIVL